MYERFTDRARRS